MSSASLAPLPPLRRGIAVEPRRLRFSWGTVAFMVAIHGLALVALLPRFWSPTAVVVLLVLYWLTACVGVTLGYHRLLVHSSFQVPRWLEAVITTCTPTIRPTTTTVIWASGGATSPGCCTMCPPSATCASSPPTCSGWPITAG